MSLDLSPGIYHGALIEVVEAEGTGLVGDHTAGATVLTVAAGGFRTAGQCRVDANTYAYVREGDSLAITPALVADAEDGTPVESLTPEGNVETRKKAVVDLDMLGEDDETGTESEDLPRAEIPGEYAGYYPIGAAAAGTFIDVTDTPYGYRVLGRPTDAPLLDQAVIDVPFIDLYRTADTTWPDDPGPGATFTGFAGWLIDSRSDMTIASGIITPALPERYLLVLTVRWAGNSSGRRVIRLVSSVAGDLKTIPATPPDADPFTQQAVVIHRAVPGETFQALARQTSGAGLDVIGTGTTLQIVRLQA